MPFNYGPHHIEGRERVSALAAFLFVEAARAPKLSCAYAAFCIVSCSQSLPLFATDTSLGAALLGPNCVSEWLAITPLLEARGMPKVDEQMGGR